MPDPLGRQGVTTGGNPKTLYLSSRIEYDSFFISGALSFNTKKALSWVLQKSQENLKANPKRQGRKVPSPKRRLSGVPSRGNHRGQRAAPSYNPRPRKAPLPLTFVSFSLTLPLWELGPQQAAWKRLRNSSRRCLRIAVWPLWWFPISPQVIPVCFQAFCKNVRLCGFWK